MKGQRVPRKAGWDCHGIPVELEVEKELGITRKPEIERYGVADFNARCRESVLRYVDDWERLTERIGFWVDTDDAYWTMSTEYVESVWWSLARLWDEGLVYEGHRVVPYCPRCGTALSDHEVSQGYAETQDPSVYVRLPVTEGPLAEAGASLLVWTTTPWTLVSNTAAAVGPHLGYVLARAAGDDYPVVLAAERVTAVLGEDAQVLRDVGVDELVGLHYRAPFDFVDPGEGTHWRYVVTADFVSLDEGTGIVHMAPAFGAEDLQVGRAHDLPLVNPVDAEGRFTADVTPFAGRFVKDADTGIIEDLRERGLLVRAERFTHTYPFCWRCSTPLLYYAKPSWYIATTRIRDRLLAENADVDWRPAHIRDGRFGDWLANNVDWALSRERYWGTPLPLWRCTGCAAVTAVSSLADLSERAGRDLSTLDPHRPYVDEVGWACADCSGDVRRVPEVIDAWYDSGSMPFAQFGYPHARGSEEVLAERYPADYICEAIDQTRGWFYSLMAVGTLLFDATSYRRVLCLGHIVDADGRKMSKSAGNILDPWELIAERGADALRWLVLTDGSPWVSRRVGAAPLAEVTRKVLLTLWNTYFFFVTYARLEGWAPSTDPAATPEPRDRPVMDRWVLAELAALVRAVDADLDDFDATSAGRRLAGFLDDLSNWYVRRSRSRFWNTQEEAAATTDAAFATLHECLVTLCGLLAPFIPFLADELYENLVVGVDADAPDSVHLVRFPHPDARADDDRLRSVMGVARRAVELGRRAREDAKMPGRQPLRAAVVTVPDHVRGDWHLVADEVAAELNVERLELPDADDTLVRRSLRPNFRALGPVFGPRTPRVAEAIRDADADAVVGDLQASGRVEVEVDGDPVSVDASMLQVTEEAVTGWEVASDGTMSVALDLTLDDRLRRAGQAREVVRVVNDLRRTLGLNLDDRIVLHLDAEGELATAIVHHREEIARETLAVAVETVRTGAAGGFDGGVSGQAAGDAEERVVSGGRLRLRILPATLADPLRASAASV